VALDLVVAVDTGDQPPQAVLLGKVLVAIRIEVVTEPVRQPQVRMAKRLPGGAGRAACLEVGAAHPLDLLGAEKDAWFVRPGPPRQQPGRDLQRPPSHLRRQGTESGAVSFRRHLPLRTCAQRPASRRSRTRVSRNSCHWGRMRSGVYCSDTRAPSSTNWARLVAAAGDIRPASASSNASTEYGLKYSEAAP